MASEICFEIACAATFLGIYFISAMFHRKQTRLNGNTLLAYVEQLLAGPRSLAVFLTPHPPAGEKLHP